MYINYNSIAKSRAMGRNPSKGKILTSDNIDWAEGADIYETSASIAEELHQQAHNNAVDIAYSRRISKKEEEYQLLNPESGEYEGNWSDEFPHPGYNRPSDMTHVRATAGQRDFISGFVEHQKYNIEAFMPKLVEMIGSWHVTRNSEGLVSALQFCKDHFNTPERMGIFRLLTLNSKSSYLQKQYLGDNRYYSALVPVVMYAQRKAKNILYSEWDRSEIHLIVPSKLAEAMLWEGEAPSPEDCLRDRDQGLTYQSGVSIGKKRPAISTHKLYATNGTVYEGMPEYCQVMYAQIWCAHPDNRIKYMVLDPLNWDNIPVPLIAPETLRTTYPGSNIKTSTEFEQWGG